MSATLTTFLFEAANFLVLTAALGWLFFQPVRKSIADFRTKFESDNQQAAQKLAEAESLRQAIQAEKEALLAELSARRTNELAGIKAQADKLLAEARVAADRERERSLVEAARLSDTQRDTLATVAATVAAESVEHLLEQIGGPDLQSALIHSACLQIVQWASSSLAPVKIESSQPLSALQMTEVKKALGSAGETADFRIVDNVGVGVRISTSKGLVDASARGLRNFASQSLVKAMNHCTSHRDSMSGVHDV